jgi:hypothetical protein
MVMISRQALPVIRIHKIFYKDTEVAAISDEIMVMNIVMDLVMVMVQGDSKSTYSICY